MVTVDPEFKKELEESRKNMANPGAMSANAAANFDLAGYLSGASSHSNAASSANAAKPGKGNKKR